MAHRMKVIAVTMLSIRNYKRMIPKYFLVRWDGNHTLEHVLPELKRKGISRVWLMPFLSVVGRHARNDMAGSDDESWKSQLEAAGVQCVPMVRGLAEYSGFVEIWLDHLEATLALL